MYFLSLKRGRRRKLFIHRIKENGEWLQGNEKISKAACYHFQTIFTSQDKVINKETLEVIPKMVNYNQNDNLISMPSMEEL